MVEPAGNGLECAFPLKGKGLTERGESNKIYIEKREYIYIDLLLNPKLLDHLITPADVGAHDRFVGICSMG